MNVAIAFGENDEAQFRRWLKWVEELGCGSGHQLFVLPFKGLSCPEIAGWRSVTMLRDYSGVRSDWNATDPTVRDASGPNFAFREIARFIHENKRGPWLFMEPDAIPLTTEAFNVIERDYHKSGKRYMGARVTAPNTPEHMSGIAVYPGDLPVSAMNYMRPRLAHIGTRHVEAAFNLAGAPDAFESFAETRLIQQEHRHPPFTMRSEAESLIENGRVIFHSDKSGSLITLLRSGTADSGTAKSESKGVFVAPPSFTPTRQPETASPVLTEKDAIEFLVSLSKRSGIDKGRITKRLAEAGFVMRPTKKK